MGFYLFWLVTGFQKDLDIYTSFIYTVLTRNSFGRLLIAWLPGDSMSRNAVGGGLELFRENRFLNQPTTFPDPWTGGLWLIAVVREWGAGLAAGGGAQDDRGVGAANATGGMERKEESDSRRREFWDPGSSLPAKGAGLRWFRGWCLKVLM